MFVHTIMNSIGFLISLLIQISVTLGNGGILSRQEATAAVQQTINAAVVSMMTPEPQEEVTPAMQPDYFFSPAEPQLLPTVPAPTAAVPTEPSAPLASDTFENGSSGFGLPAGLYEDEDIRINAINGFLTIEPKRSNGWTTWRLRPPQIADCAAEMSFLFISCDVQDKVGIILRAPDYENGNGYYFTIDCAGKAAINRGGEQLAAGDAYAYLETKPLKANVLRAEAKGSHLTLLLNGSKVCETDDPMFQLGFSGFFTAPYGQGSLRVQVSKFELFGL